MIRLLLMISIIGYGTTFAQVYTASEAENTNPLVLTKDHKITINKVNAATEGKYIVRNENNEVVNVKRSFNKTRQSLVLDLSALFSGEAPQSAFVLELPNTAKVDLVLEKKVSVTNTLARNPANSSLGFSGIAIWDAQLIKKVWANKPDKDSKEIILEWINHYVAEDKKKSWEEIMKNPFFGKTDLLVEINKSTAGTIESAVAIPGVKEIIGNLAGLDVTKYVQAFADFLKERIKEELTVAYLQKLKKAIESSEELQYMLPQTRNVFLKNDIFYTPNLGATYKAAFAQDLENLLPNFETLVYSSKNPMYVSLRKTDGFIGFISAYHFADMSAKSYHPAEILLHLDGNYGFATTPDSKISYGLSVLNSFSRNLLDTSGTKWIAGNELRNFTKDEVYIFIGLLYEKYNALFEKQAGTTNIKNILLDISSSGIIDKVSELLSIINTVDERIKAFKESPAKDQTVVGFFSNNADAIIELFGYVTRFTKIQDVFSDEYNKVKMVLEYSVEAVKGVKENNPGKLGSNVLSLINELTPGDQTWKRNLGEFIVLLTDFANAKTSEDIKAVLDHHAAPVHSYRVARLYHSSTAITSY
ncbi:MAG: hypothetical protein ACXWV9_06840, partial [Flavisolibacter sp.]